MFVPRSSILFVTGLLSAAAFAFLTEQSLAWNNDGSVAGLDFDTSETLTVAVPREFSGQKERAVEIAWQYIVQNTRPETGLVDSVAGFPSTTLWDQGSYLFALIGARELGAIDEEEFDRRAKALLKSLGDLPLFDGKLPNKAYDTRSLAMVNYQNEVSENGIGWSALDVCRLLMAFRSLERLVPHYGAEIRSLLSGWDLAAMAKNGELWGAAIEDGEIVYLQEGRMGYEQYAARAAAMWGLDVFGAMSGQRVLQWVDVLGVEVPTDRRDAKRFTAISPILSEPYLLQAFEIGLDSETQIYASRVYQAQENRYQRTGQLTSVSEDHVDQDPYFLYSSVMSDGAAWAVVTETGYPYPELRTISTKASFGWNALFSTEYSNKLVEHIYDLGKPDKGWPAGVYESDGRVNDVYTLNTNAVIIEAVHFSVFGPFWTR
ncbi:MAG: DUF3131 domain-containing protein [Pseudomonadota bacterium]|nr:DUF3131 domain-containing protein [Pseudomonadota bacterium]